MFYASGIQSILNMKIFRSILIYVFIITAIVLVCNIPVSTRQGINYEVTSRQMPLYVKAAAFIHRDFEYRDLSRRITNGIEGHRERIEAIYGWTLKNIREIPPGFPIVDDHIWDIIVRRYGASDQMADVFTTLASYAGYEAFWDNLRSEKTGGGLLTLAFVKVGKKWYAFDIDNKKTFIDLESESERAPDGVPYSHYFKNIDKKSFKSRWRRPGNQKVIPRVINELKNILSR